MNQIEKGLEFCREKLFDQKNRLDENHRCIARTLMIMGEVLENHNSNEALKTYEKALSILENCSSIDYETTSECLISIAHLCLNTGLVEQGLELAQTALDYNRRIFSSNNIVIAQNLTTIAKFYKQMKNSSKAFEYYNESLLIYRTNYESEHRTVKEVEADIARLKNILNNQ
jgi:tetratricopeptide (TPR) repeat protein